MREVLREGLGLCLALLGAIILSCDFMYPRQTSCEVLVCGAAQKHSPSRTVRHTRMKHRTAQGRMSRQLQQPTDPPCWGKEPVRTLSHLHGPEDRSFFSCVPCVLPFSTLVLILICVLPHFPALQRFPASQTSSHLQSQTHSDPSLVTKAPHSADGNRVKSWDGSSAGGMVLGLSLSGACVVCLLQLVLRYRLQFTDPLSVTKQAEIHAALEGNTWSEFSSEMFLIILFEKKVKTLMFSLKEK